MEEELKKKPTITEKAIKNQKTIIVIAVFCIITLFAGTSYSLLTNYDTNDSFITFKEGNKVISTNKISGVIKFLKNYEPDSEIDMVRPVVITFQNKGKEDISSYQVKLVTSSNSLFKDEDIMFSISTDLGISYLEPASLKATNGVIYLGDNLKIEEAKTIYIRMWYLGDIPLNATNNTYDGELKIAF